WFNRYLPFLATVAAIALIAIVLPGRQPETVQDTATDLTTDFSDVELEDTTEGNVAAKVPTRVLGTNKSLPSTQTGVLTFEEAKKKGAALVANCDSGTGAVMIPSRFAPPCTQKFSGTNAGKTWQGVDSKTIDVVWFTIEGNPAVDAFLAAAGADDSPEQVQQTVRDWGKLYETHFNTWGRTVKWHFVDATGDASDDQAALSDARKIANEIKAFAVIGASNNTMVNELVARKVMCFCTTSLPIELYLKWSPYVWTSLMASTQGYIHRGEYIAKRLAGRNAIWAHDDVNPLQSFKDEKRRFFFLYYDTDDHSYKSGADFFVKYMKDKYGITIPPDAVSQYNGYPDIQRTQEQSPGIIQKMLSSYGGQGSTSVICSCDPFGPAFFTKDAETQRYGPEWIITGSALTDTAFFARTYNQAQWRHAFGISYLAARLDEEKGGAARLYKWHYNKFPPPAEAGYGLINAPINQFYNGVHMAGPSLTPSSYRSGMYRLPLTGKGGITTIAQSYGDKGLWPWKDDPIAADDATEVWWDADASGPAEVGGIEGNGLYRYVAMGKRYLAGEWPSSLPLAFNKKNTALIYEDPPKADQWPCYPSPATKKKDLC
ncbi:MAG: hypothetical protein WD826_01565, partial [Actinomycetota bacterium]